MLLKLLLVVLALLTTAALTWGVMEYKHDEQCQPVMSMKCYR
jgi:hypothetical protein